MDGIQTVDRFLMKHEPTDVSDERGRSSDGRKTTEAACGVWILVGESPMPQEATLNGARSRIN